MDRRAFMTLATATALWPAGAPCARENGPTRIGVLHPFSTPHPWTIALRRGLRDLGYVEGRTIIVDERGSDGQDELLDKLAQDFIDSKVDIIVAMTGPPFQAAKRRTDTVPIVMAVSSDGVGAAGVASLARPGGNVTGLTLMGPDLDSLRLGLLKEAIPSARRIAIIYDPEERPSVAELNQTELGAAELGLVLTPVQARGSEALDQAFRNSVSAGSDAFFTFAHAFTYFNRVKIAELAAQYRLPGMYGWREYAEAGGLMVYGPNVSAVLYRAASFVHRIIKGELPAEMPIEQPTKFELVINLRTAKALGLTMPQTLLLRADDVIE